MHQRLDAAQRLQNHRVETDLLWDINWNEHIIKNSSKHRLAYQNLEYLVEKNRIEAQKEWVYNQVLSKCNKNRVMYNSIAWNCYQQEYKKQMCENCINNSLKVYKLHNSIKFKLE